MTKKQPPLLLLGAGVQGFDSCDLPSCGCQAIPEPPARYYCCRIILSWDGLNAGDDRDRAQLLTEFFAEFSAKLAADSSIDSMQSPIPPLKPGHHAHCHRA